jgi:hypothetical protein
MLDVLEQLIDAKGAPVVAEVQKAIVEALDSSRTVIRDAMDARSKDRLQSLLTRIIESREMAPEVRAAATHVLQWS